MSVDKDTVAKIAKLARIELPEEDREALAGELTNILGWVEQLSELDTEGVEPMTSVVAMDLPQRPDRITDGDIVEKVLANAPEGTERFFAVPKVVE